MDPLHEAMIRPETYPENDAPVEWTETHVSRLYFTARHVYKIKKPVDFGFLDFTTLDRRRFYCQEEVRLNDRFAPGTYLGVVDIRRTAAGIRIGNQGEILEYAVWMRRLPAEMMLDRWIAQSDPGLPAQMTRLGHRLARLHAESEVCRHDAGRPNLEVVGGNWRENFEQTARFVGSTISARAMALITDYVGLFLEKHAPLLLRREADGQVRDGHGDLHAEHVCLTEPVQIYDCIEFNRRFRIADSAADLAFLLMDLEYRDRRDLAAKLLSVYEEGRVDHLDMATLIPFYKLYRAFVRGKVDSFLAADTAASAEIRGKAARDARRYFNLALGYLAGPVLVLTSGLMGTGKSTIAAALAATIGADLLRSDDLRKKLAGNEAAGGRSAAFEKGIYSADFTRRTYDLLLEKAGAALRCGRSVVADASFARRQERDRIRQIALEAGVPVIMVSTECNRETALQRLDKRLREETDISDGRRELYDRQAVTFEAMAESEEGIRIDTTAELDYNIHLLLCEIIAKAGKTP